MLFYFCRVQKEVGVAETDIQATLDRVQNLLQEQADIRSVNLPIYFKSILMSKCKESK